MNTSVFRKLPASICRVVQGELDLYYCPDDGDRKLLCGVST
jgi:hypothetical protein